MLYAATKSRHSLPLALLLLALLATAVAWAGDTEVSVRETRVPAHRIDFEAALGTNHADLRDLGARIERAREAAEPLRLALLSLELQAWEAASGQEAALTAAALRQEAVALAVLRRRSAELRALMGLFPEVAAQETADGVTVAKLAEAVTAMELARQKDREAGETKRGVSGTIQVQNDTGEWIRIYVDGVLVGQVAPWDVLRVPVQDEPWKRTVLEGRGTLDSVWTLDVLRPQRGLTWELTDGNATPAAPAEATAP